MNIFDFEWMLNFRMRSLKLVKAYPAKVIWQMVHSYDMILNPILQTVQSLHVQ